MKNKLCFNEDEKSDLQSNMNQKFRVNIFCKSQTFCALYTAAEFNLTKRRVSILRHNLQMNFLP